MTFVPFYFQHTLSGDCPNELFHSCSQCSKLDSNPDPFSYRKQTNDMVVAAVNLLNSHIQDFDAVKVRNFSTLHNTQNLRLKKLRRVQRIFGRIIRA